MLNYLISRLVKTKALLFLFIAISIFSCKKDSGIVQLDYKTLSGNTWIKYNYHTIYYNRFETFGFKDTTKFYFYENKTFRYTYQSFKLTDSMAYYPPPVNKVKITNSSWSSTYSINNTKDTLSLSYYSNPNPDILNRWRSFYVLPNDPIPTYLKIHIIQFTRNSLVLSPGDFLEDTYIVNK